MVQDLYDLYTDLTESRSVSIVQNKSTIEIKIVSRWFDNMSHAERMDYLWEAMQAIYPDLMRKFKIKFIALSPREQN